MSAPLLTVDGLSIRRGERCLVQDVSFALARGEALGIVGESGSGKSLSLLALLRLLPEGMTQSARRLRFGEQDLDTLPPAALRAIRGRKIGLVFQDALTALDPLMTIGRQIAESLPRGRAEEAPAVRVHGLLHRVGIADPEARARQYPHELSGGMRQRACIAMALAAEPELLMLDEPTTALDPTVQAAIVARIDEIRGDTGLTVIWVTHDLPLLARVAERVLVMFGGRIMEDAPVDALFRNPRHPYSKALLAATGAAEESDGALAAPRADGCPYSGRCAHADLHCRSAPPPMTELGGGVRVACWREADRDDGVAEILA